MISLIFKSLLVYSQNKGHGFHTHFSDTVNIIHGRNTSGKSTLIQSIIYSMGINDSKENLSDINDPHTIFRLDCELTKENEGTKLSFIRSDDTIVLAIDNKPPMRFDGINSNNSYEYKKYKDIISSLFSFKLLLQQQGEQVKAPLEAAMLPYYISQSVGWVYIRESIGNYRFYKDFKYDYLDYYCGIESNARKIEKYKLEKEKKELTFELKQLESYEEGNKQLKISKIIDEKIKGEASRFFDEYQELNNDLTAKESEQTKLCNKISMLKNRQKVLSQVIRNIKHQVPEVDSCPTCQQRLPGDLREFYKYTQNVNDAISELEKTKSDIKKTSSSLNSSEVKIKKLRSEFEEKYGLMERVKIENVSINSWIDHQSNLKMLKKIEGQKAFTQKTIDGITSKIEENQDGDIEDLRKKADGKFLKIFKSKVKSLKIKLPKENKYKEIYSINAFPYQGVELHQLLMAYNFSFYEMVSKNKTLHTLPFIMDAVFKEDIDIESRKNIFDFLSKETNNGQQVIFSVAEYKNNSQSNSTLFDIEEVKRDYFTDDTKLICIGDSKTKRSFMSSKLIAPELIESTLSLFESA
ncbi:hypothetical protein [Pelagibaculum spongiae]|uniref:Rad50/SbcC-type AAA domain-containing protein n=1 Tax=Pelagibaculum spongiae TaxID=2080658 RepID=A0A2V1H099_9GAMM|nr:hypothetical protein [Pelagibaculum spongiae]PVZ70624.1 hypothetical protein DC094_08590 [Pelagibaculum spongiae]